MEPSIHLIERRDRRGRRVPALAALAVITVLGATVFGLFGFLETNAAFGTALDLEEKYLCDVEDFALDFPEVSTLSEVYTRDGVLLGKLTERNSQPIAIAEVPDMVKWAMISAEDGDFYDHEGIDFTAIARAAVLNYRTGNVTGGSTITQQIIKKNFLTEEQTIERKICEAVVAAELERIYTKDQILEFYMNSQFFGENAYGVKAAAEEYFAKDLTDLTVAEAAAMVVPIRNPSLYRIRTNTDVVVERRNSVIEQMEKNGFISPAEAAEALAEPLAPVPHEEYEKLSPQVIDAARDELLNDPVYGLGDTYLQRKKALFGCPASDADCEGGGGLRVTVTVDHEMQTEANRILRAWFQDIEGPTGAIAMVENGTGAIRVMASGLEFGTDIQAGQRPYDLARKGRRQAGSAFKPIALLAALEYGAQAGWPITLGTFWDYSSPKDIDCGYPCGTDGSNTWRVSNAGGANSGGVRSLEQATYLSTNTVYAQVSVATGPDNIVEMAHRIGIDSPLAPYPSIALGTQSVSPLEMAAAYSTIANYGEKVDSYIIERIEDKDGNVIYDHEVSRERVLDQALTAAAVRAMKKVVSQGTATAANIGRPQAGKTGTAQDFKDVWFMGFIPQYTTAVWVGHADRGTEMTNFTLFNDMTQRPQYYSRAYGGTVAAPIWKQFMLYITENLPEADFPDEPEGTGAYFRVPTVTVPNVSGMSPSRARAAIFDAGLNARIAYIASTAPENTFLGQSPGGGARISQGRSVSVFYSNGQPAVMWSFIGESEDSLPGAVESFNASTGLNVSYTVEYRTTNKPRQGGQVIGQSPAAGAGVDYGQTVVFFVGVYEESGGDDG